MFWPFTVWTNCSSDIKFFANSRPSASNFKSFSRSLEQFFLIVCQNNFGNKIPFFKKLLVQIQKTFLVIVCMEFHLIQDWIFKLYLGQFLLAKNVPSWQVGTYFFPTAKNGLILLIRLLWNFFAGSTRRIWRGPRGITKKRSSSSHVFTIPEPTIF